MTRSAIDGLAPVKEFLNPLKALGGVGCEHSLGGSAIWMWNSVLPWDLGLFRLSVPHVPVVSGRVILIAPPLGLFARPHSDAQFLGQPG